MTNDTEPNQSDDTGSVGSPSEFDAIVSERDRLQAQLTRTMADLQNIRKRHVKEMEDARQRTIESVVAELLPVLDNFQLALSAHERHETAEVKSETHAMVEGLTMIRGLLTEVLERHGLAEIPSLGEAFDPNVHEAIGIDPSASSDPGTVSQVVQPGYQLRDRLIRVAKVLVAAPPKSDAPPEDQ